MSFRIIVGPTARESEVRHDGRVLQGVTMLSVHVDANSNAAWATLRVILDQANIEVKRGHMFTEVGGREYMLVPETDNDAGDPAEIQGDRSHERTQSSLGDRTSEDATRSGTVGDTGREVASRRRRRT